MIQFDTVELWIFITLLGLSALTWIIFVKNRFQGRPLFETSNPPSARWGFVDVLAVFLGMIIGNIAGNGIYQAFRIGSLGQEVIEGG